MKPCRHRPFWRRALRALGSRFFHFAENNGDARPEHNGERWFLRHLLKDASAADAARPFVVCDAGANIGGYTQMVLAEARRIDRPVEVHAFEPSPRCHEQLQHAFKGQPMVCIAGVALADRTGTATLFSGQSSSTHASLVVRGTGPADGVNVPTVRLEDYMKVHRIDHIGLLKLDIEGMELAALHGLGEYLRPDVVAALQFEYGGTTLAANARLRDFYHLLEPRGYLLAKLFPHFLEQRRYADWMEHYAYANYAALAPHLLTRENPSSPR